MNLLLRKKTLFKQLRQDLHKTPVIPAEETGSSKIEPRSTRFALDRDDNTQRSCVSSARLIRAYSNLIRFDKPIGSILLLWPTLWGLWLANNGLPNSHVLIVFLFGVFFMRSAGCAINDITDRNFDGQVARTLDRPLVTNKLKTRLSVKQAYGLVIVFCSLAFLLVLSLKNMNLILHCFIALGLTSIYPFCKRFFNCPQFILGLAFGYAIPMAYVASYVEFSQITWLVYSLSIILTIVYDTFYAMSDMHYDAKLGLKSSALWFNHWFGCYDLAIIAVLQLSFIVNLLLIAYLLEFWLLYLVSASICILFCYQLKLASTRESDKCLQAFRNNNYVGLLVWLGLVFSIGI